MACSASDTVSDTPTIERPATHEKVTQAIVKGFAAIDEDSPDARAIAGSRLIQLRAKPLRDMPDLAQAWVSDTQDTTRPMRGRVRGPGYRVKQLPAGESDAFNEIFYGVEETTVSVTGNGNYRIEVLDEDGRPPLCIGDTLCRFTPDVTASYQIIIRNKGASGRYIFVAD